MRRGNDQRIAIGKVVGDFLTAVVGVVTLDTDFGKLANDFWKSTFPGQRSLCTLLDNPCLFRVHGPSPVWFLAEFNRPASLSTPVGGRCLRRCRPASSFLPASGARGARGRGRRRAGPGRAPAGGPPPGG